MGHRRAAWVVWTWLLVTSRDPAVPIDEWKTMDRFPTSRACDYAREAAAHDAANRELGALAYTDAQNPVRVTAWEKAHRRVSSRFRCVEDRSTR